MMTVLKIWLIANGVLLLLFGGITLWVGLYKHFHPNWNPFL